MSNFNPDLIRIKRTLYCATYFDGSKKQSIHVQDVKDKKKVIKKLEQKTVFYTCRFSDFQKIAKVEKNKQPQNAAQSAHSAEARKEGKDE